MNEKEWSKEGIGWYVAKTGTQQIHVPPSQAQSLAPSTGTPMAPSRSSKKPPETSTTGIYCYLGSGISIYDILHMVQRDTGAELQFTLHQHREGSSLPSRLSQMDRWGGVGPHWHLLHASSMASAPHQDIASVLQLGHHLVLPWMGTEPHADERTTAKAFATKKIISKYV